MMSKIMQGRRMNWWYLDDNDGQVIELEDDEEDTDDNNGDNGDENDHCIYLETLKILSTEHSQTESEMST